MIYSQKRLLINYVKDKFLDNIQMPYLELTFMKELM